MRLNVVDITKQLNDQKEYEVVDTEIIDEEYIKNDAIYFPKDYQSKLMQLLESKTKRINIPKEDINYFLRDFHQNGLHYEIKPKPQEPLLQLELKVSNLITGEELIRNDFNIDALKNGLFITDNLGAPINIKAEILDVNKEEIYQAFKKEWQDSSSDEILQIAHKRINELKQQEYELDFVILDNEAQIELKEEALASEYIKLLPSPTIQKIEDKFDLPIKEVIKESIKEEETHKEEPLFKDENVSIFNDEIKINTDSDEVQLKAKQIDSSKGNSKNINNTHYVNNEENKSSANTEETQEQTKKPYNAQEALDNIINNTIRINNDLVELRANNRDKKAINKALKKELRELELYVAELETANNLAKEEFDLKKQLLHYTLNANSSKETLRQKEEQTEGLDGLLEQHDYHTQIDPQVISEMLQMVDEDDVMYARLKVVQNGFINSEELLPEQINDLETLCKSGILFKNHDGFEINDVEQNAEVLKNIVALNVDRSAAAINFIKENTKIGSSQENETSQIQSNVQEQNNKQKDAWIAKTGGIENLSQEDIEVASNSYSKWKEPREERGLKVYSFEDYVDYVQNKFQEEKHQTPSSISSQNSLADKENIHAFRQ